MSDPDVQLVRFFHGVVLEEIERDTPAVDHKESLKLVAKSPNYDHRNESWKTPLEDATSSSLRCAQVFHRAPCLASTCRRHFTQLLRDNSFLLQRIVMKGTFRICCCTQDSTVPVEFVSAVETLLHLVDSFYSSSDGRAKTLHVQVVVVASRKSRWTSTVCKMADRLRKGPSSCCGQLDFSLLSADLAEPLTDDVKETLGQSDFVTMVHFLSRVHENGDCLESVKEIIPFIREGATLFFLDFPEFHLCDAVRNTIGSFENMMEIYGPLRNDVHRISLLCRKECLRLYSKYYGWRHCAMESRNYVCAWLKKPSRSLFQPR